MLRGRGRDCPRMTIGELRDRLESRQVLIYFAAVGIGVIVAMLVSGTERLEPAVNPALALMLFVTFLQVPIASLRKAFRNGRFFGALLPAVIVTQTLVGLVASLVYIRVMPRLGAKDDRV